MVLVKAKLLNTPQVACFTPKSQEDYLGSQIINKSGVVTFEYKLRTNPLVYISADLDGERIIYNYNDMSVVASHFDNINKVSSQVYSMLKSSNHLSSLTKVAKSIQGFDYNIWGSFF